MKTSIKYLMLVLGCTALMGCATVQGIVTKFTDVSCSDQIEAADAVVDTLVVGITKAYETEVIDSDKKSDLADKLLDGMNTLDEANAACADERGGLGDENTFDTKINEGLGKLAEIQEAL